MTVNGAQLSQESKPVEKEGGDHAKYANIGSIGNLHNVLVSAGTTDRKAKSSHKIINIHTLITLAPPGRLVLLAVHMQRK